LHQAGSYGSSCNARSRDLSILVKEEEGIKGNFLTESTESLAKAIEAILNNDDYRRELAMTNYKAACELSMDKIVQMYTSNFKQVNYNKLLRWVND
jgi:molybdopterin-guanine dinucleotide biosynthesis protein A